MSDSFAKLCADLVAESPHKTEAEHRHTLELRYGYRMADPALRAVLARAIDADHEVDDTDADKAAYDYEPESEVESEDSPSLAGGFTGPGVEGKLAEFEAPAPPGKSAGCQKLDQLNPQRKDHEQRAGARRKTIDMSEKAEGAAGRDAPRRLLPCPMQ
jgi:hypothetical protein